MQFYRYGTERLFHLNFYLGLLFCSRPRVAILKYVEIFKTRYGGS